MAALFYFQHAIIQSINGSFDLLFNTISSDCE